MSHLLSTTKKDPPPPPKKREKKEKTKRKEHEHETRNKNKTKKRNNEHKEESAKRIRLQWLYQRDKIDSQDDAHDSPEQAQVERLLRSKLKSTSITEYLTCPRSGKTDGQKIIKKAKNKQVKYNEQKNTIRDYFKVYNAVIPDEPNRAPDLEKVEPEKGPEAVSQSGKKV